MFLVGVWWVWCYTPCLKSFGSVSGVFRMISRWLHLQKRFKGFQRDLSGFTTIVSWIWRLNLFQVSCSALWPRNPFKPTKSSGPPLEFRWNCPRDPQNVSETPWICWNIPVNLLNPLKLPWRHCWSLMRRSETFWKPSRTFLKHPLPGSNCIVFWVHVSWKNMLLAHSV